MTRIYVLLSTYNGEKWLETLIASIESQLQVEIVLIVRDDGSSYPVDIKECKLTIELCNHIKENLGPSESFSHLLQHVPRGSFAAYCDQDDIWEEERLILGYSALRETVGPAISSGQVRLIDGRKTWPKRKARFSFANSLYENQMIGCTMTLNPEAVDLLKEFTPPYGVLHDEWAYSLISYVGKVIYVPKVLVNYRVHQDNHSGINVLFRNRPKIQFQRFVKWQKQYNNKLKKAEALRKLNLETNFQNQRTLLRYIEAHKNVGNMAKHILLMRVSRSSVLDKIAISFLSIALFKKNFQD
jgi:glycosyltransferase involved in cell wall biosynthesis